MLILFSIVLFACENSDAPSTPETKVLPVDVGKVIVFDAEFSGLVDLPVDKGGEHKAYPLGPDSDSGLGYYAYFPSGYDDNDYEYPLLLFLHGSGERSISNSIPPNQLDKVLIHGPPQLIEAKNWNPTYPCLVISPQSEGDWTPDLIHRFIKFLIENYRVNTKRIYLTGLSMGGHGCWFYEGTKGNSSYATALVPICGRGPLGSTEKLVDTPIWAFHGEKDELVRAFTNNGSFLMVNQINANNPKFPAKLTIYPEVGHNSWERTYDNSGMGTESLEYDPFDLSIYDWMFQFRKE